MRNHSALVLWSYISMYSYEEQAQKAVLALETTIYAELKLKELETAIKKDLWVMHSPASLAVCFRRPNEKILRKFCLSGHRLHVHCWGVAPVRPHLCHGWSYKIKD